MPLPLGVIVGNIVRAIGTRAIGPAFRLLKKVPLRMGFAVAVAIGMDMFGKVVGSPAAAKVVETGAKVAVLALVFNYFQKFLEERLGPLQQTMFDLMPSFQHSAVAPLFELMRLTNAFVPWQDLGILAKWVFAFYFFVLMWHLLDYVIRLTYKFLAWIF